MGAYKSKAETLDAQMDHMETRRHSAVLDVTQDAAYCMESITRNLEHIDEYVFEPRYAAEYLNEVETDVEGLRKDIDLLLAIEDGSAIWDEKTKGWEMP